MPVVLKYGRERRTAPPWLLVAGLLGLLPFLILAVGLVTPLQLRVAGRVFYAQRVSAGSTDPNFHARLAPLPGVDPEDAAAVFVDPGCGWTHEPAGRYSYGHVTVGDEVVMVGSCW